MVDRDRYITLSDAAKRLAKAYRWHRYATPPTILTLLYHGNLTPPIVDPEGVGRHPWLVLRDDLNQILVGQEQIRRTRLAAGEPLPR